MLEYARWKYILVAGVLAVALLFALPNVFGDDYAIQLLQKSKEPITETQLAAIESSLKNNGVGYGRLSKALPVSVRAQYTASSKVLIAKINRWPAMPDHSRERAWLREAGQPFG